MINRELIDLKKDGKQVHLYAEKIAKCLKSSRMSLLLCIGRYPVKDFNSIINGMEDKSRKW